MNETVQVPMQKGTECRPIGNHSETIVWLIFEL